MKKKLLISASLALIVVGTIGSISYLEAKAASKTYYTSADIAFSSSLVNVDIYSEYQANIANSELQKLVTWTSSDINVATIDENGLISSRAVGETVINASYENLASSFTLNVYNSYSAPYFKLNATEVRLGVGDTFDITATFISKNETIENAKITWQSEDTNVAKISGNNVKGTISAYNPGKTTIYMSTTYNGVFVNAAVSVEVVEEIVSIGFLNKNVALVNGEYVVNVDFDNYLDLEPEVYVDGKLSKTNFTWSTLDSEIATITKTGVIYGVSKGQSYVVGEYGNASKVLVKVYVK